MIHEVEAEPVMLGPTRCWMMAQYSPDWWRLRCGYPTASAADRILTPTGKLSAQARKYVAELIGDRCCLTPNFFTDRPVTRDMANGSNMEPEARRWYAMERPESRIQQVGFCVDASGRYGCSPDALVDDDGVCELKCPRLSTQVEYLEDGVLPSDYVPQCHMHLIVTGRKWVDFTSYAPGLPGFIVRLVPDSYTEKLRVALEDFHNLYQSAIKRIAPHLLEAANVSSNA